MDGAVGSASPAPDRLRVVPGNTDGALTAPDEIADLADDGRVEDRGAGVHNHRSAGGPEHIDIERQAPGSARRHPADGVAGVD